MYVRLSEAAMGGYVVLVIAGDLNASTATVLPGHLGGQSGGDVILDVTGVSLAHAAGLAALLAADCAVPEPAVGCGWRAPASSAADPRHHRAGSLPHRVCRVRMTSVPGGKGGSGAQVPARDLGSRRHRPRRQAIRSGREHDDARAAV